AGADAGEHRAGPDEDVAQIRHLTSQVRKDVVAEALRLRRAGGGEGDVAVHVSQFSSSISRAAQPWWPWWPSGPEASEPCPAQWHSPEHPRPVAQCAEVDSGMSSAGLRSKNPCGFRVNP